MTSLSKIIAALSIITLSACGEDRSIVDFTCNGLEADPSIFAEFQTVAPAMTTALAQQSAVFESGAVSAPEEETRAAITSAMARMIAAKSGAINPSILGLEMGTTKSTRPQINVLALSTGGQYGAFGSGFLAGWGENTSNPRPSFDLVTGASAGGVFAPFVFAGPAFDKDLSLNAGVSNADVYRERSFFELLNSASLYDTKPLEARVSRTVDADLMTAMADGYKEGRALLLGATNLDTGQFVAFDLGAYAASEAPKTDCVKEAVMATSAIPALFGPRKINGDFYVDAGVRSHIFTEGLRDAVDISRANPQVTLNIIVNGDLVVPSGEVKASLLDISQKSFALVTDEGMRQSVLRTLELAEDRRWRVRGIIAPDARTLGCKPDDSGGKSLFSACITDALFKRGRQSGAASQIPWLSAKQLRTRVEADRTGGPQ